MADSPNGRTDAADSPNGRTDAELLRENAERAFAELYRRHAATVHAWFRRRLE